MEDYRLDSLIYVSTARPGLGTQDFQDIVEVSQRKNLDCGITGILCFNGTNFMQYLEGDRKMVNDRLLLIGSDTRHTGMITVKRRSGTAREFPDWHMASSLINVTVQESTPNLADILAIDTVSVETRKIFNNFQLLGHGA